MVENYYLPEHGKLYPTNHSDWPTTWPDVRGQWPYTPSPWSAGLHPARSSWLCWRRCIPRHWTLVAAIDWRWCQKPLLKHTGHAAQSSIRIVIRYWKYDIRDTIAKMWRILVEQRTLPPVRVTASYQTRCAAGSPTRKAVMFVRSLSFSQFLTLVLRE